MKSAIVHTTAPNKDHRSFAVRIVLQGGSYGRDFCLTHDKPDPLIEFYDTKQPGFTEHGQFAARYYLSTLLGLDDWSRGRDPRGGLGLDGRVAVWYVEEEALRATLLDAVLWLAGDRS